MNKEHLEQLQALMTKQAHLRDSISQLRKELDEEMASLTAIDLEVRTLNEDYCNHEYERKAFFCGNGCEYSQVCKHCHKVL